MPELRAQQFAVSFVGARRWTPRWDWPISRLMTVLEAIRRGSEFLAARGVDSPRLQAEWLVAQALEVRRLQLYLQFDRELTPAQTEQARAAIQRRGRREPLQHILGTVSFCGLELRASPQALIPRPETEILAEAALGYLGALPEPDRCFLDFGTGSGCLAVALTVQCAGAVCHALDISASALALARHNATAHQVDSRIRFHQGPGFASLPAGLGFALIVSNPPYIPTAEIADLEPEVREFDPREALDGGADGLNAYRMLSAEAGPWLAPGGAMFVELGAGQAEAVRALFERHNWIVGDILADYSGVPRVLQARCPTV
jgi:release factor glutamine methyltransferase